MQKEVDLNKLVLQLEEVEQVAWFSREKIKEMIKDKILSKNQIMFFENLFEWENKK